jgi:hypothetical protein
VLARPAWRVLGSNQLQILHETEQRCTGARDEVEVKLKVETGMSLLLTAPATGMVGAAIDCVLSI